MAGGRMIENSSAYPDNMNFYGATGRNILNPVAMRGKSDTHDGMQTGFSAN